MDRDTIPTAPNSESNPQLFKDQTEADRSGKLYPDIETQSPLEGREDGHGNQPAHVDADGVESAGIVDQQTASDPILSDRSEQGIAQTGEEDPLSGVEDPAIAAAVRELSENRHSDTGPETGSTNNNLDQPQDIDVGMTPTTSYDSGFSPIGASQGHSVLAFSQHDEAVPGVVPTLRSLSSALADSVEAYETAARDGDEIFRPMFLSRAKERKEMVNEFGARILSLGGVIEGESDYTPGFASSVTRALSEGGHMLNAVEEHEADLRSIFLTALTQQTGDTQAFLQAQYAVIERSEDELRHLRSEFSAEE